MRVTLWYHKDEHPEIGPIAAKLMIDGHGAANQDDGMIDIEVVYELLKRAAAEPVLFATRTIGMLCYGVMRTYGDHAGYGGIAGPYNTLEEALDVLTEDGDVIMELSEDQEAWGKLDNRILYRRVDHKWVKESE